MSTSVAEHFFDLAPVSEEKKKKPKQTNKLLVLSQAVTMPKQTSCQWLPWQDLRAVFCHFITPFHSEVHGVEKVYLPEQYQSAWL